MNLEKNFESESPLFQSALDLYGELLPIADTELRIYSERLVEHALVLLEHVSTAAAARTRRDRARAIHFARMRQAKVVALVEAATIARQITAAQRLKLLSSVACLDLEMERARHPAGGSVPPVVDASDPVAQTVSSPPPVDRVLTEDEAADLKREAAASTDSSNANGASDSHDVRNSNDGSDLDEVSDPNDEASEIASSGVKDPDSSSAGSDSSETNDPSETNDSSETDASNEANASGEASETNDSSEVNDSNDGNGAARSRKLNS